MYPAQPFNGLFYSTASSASGANQRAPKPIAFRGSPSTPRICYMMHNTRSTRRSDFPKLELWTCTLVVRPPTLSCTQPCRATCIGIRRSAYPHSKTHSHSSRMANLILRSGSSRCVALSSGGKRSGLWRYLAAYQPCLDSVLSFFHTNSTVCACTDPACPA